MSTDRAAALLALHRTPGFVIPNAWDAGSARILEQVAFPAIATTSAGIAWSCGVPDGGALDLDTMLDHVGRIVAAVGVPVSADLEAGYGDTPEAVARTVTRAADLGVVGANLEDQVGGTLFGIEEAALRIVAARAAAPGGSFVINARTDTYLGAGAGDVFAETVERATRYVEAGADCIFVPGVNDEDTIRRLAAAVPAPLNVVAGLTSNLIDVPTLFSLGVTRVSLGGSLARVALTALERAGRELLDPGTLGFLDGAVTYADLQQRFGA
jgi:2-methylisocitrate lyase-like PEP mutase family enzyme